ncbi:unnamed protein product [Caenorhabditis angaria]|uniref:C-type lectin domain-containing protein n=1 Tax=Caenorhabditis angaria TaxID=860376 RepID=A0A9P1N4A0_9PELO|nr:unnamed protein product [Caenorhabditis angaria]
MLKTIIFLIYFVRFCDFCIATNSGGGLPVLDDELEEGPGEPEEPSTPSTTTTEEPEEPGEPTTPSTTTTGEPEEPEEPEEPTTPSTTTTEEPEEPEEPTTPSTTTTEEPEEPTDSCPDATWTLFDRGSYSWCMKAIVQSTQGPTAAQNCENFYSGSKPSGFQTATEVTTMIAQAKAANNGVDGRFYIGAYRNAACIGKMLTASCTKLNSFYWTDGETSGTAGWIWDGVQPNNWNSDQNYVYLDTSANGMGDANGAATYAGVICGIKAT